MPKLEETCNVRVPDNGDTYRCGGKILRAGYCAEHLPEAMFNGRNLLNKTLKSLFTLMERQAELEGVSLKELFAELVKVGIVK